MKKIWIRMIMTYKLQFSKRKTKKKNELSLYKGRTYIVGKSVEGYPTLEDVFILRNRCELAIDWFELWDKLIETNKSCLWCGKPIHNEPFKRQKLYCNDECRYEMQKKKDRDKDFKSRASKRLYEDTIVNKFAKEGKTLPTEFNQIDTPRKLGETRLTKHIKTTDEGEPDFKSEYYAIRNEKKRIINRN